MKKTCLLALAAGAACCTIALAKPPLQSCRPAAQVDPISIAKVAKVDGKYVLASDWIPYTGGGMGARNPMIDAPFFDSFGRNPANGPNTGAGTQCAIGCTPPWGAVDNGIRWYFGSAYENPNTVEDMQNCACPGSSVVDELDYGWYWQNTGNCVIIFFPLEQVMAFDPVLGVCNDPATFSDTGGGGVALNYGSLPGSNGDGYYYSRVAGIGGIGILSPATDKNGDPNGYADGSYHWIISSGIDSAGIHLAPGPTQPMLWGTSGSDTNGGTKDGRPGYNNGDSYDDDNPTDGVLAPNECYDYHFGICPDPLGKDSAWSYLRCPADFNNDGFVDGIDADSFNNTFESADPTVQIGADLNGDCFVDGIDSDLFNNEFESPCP